MKVTADTNILVRILTDDDPAQVALARSILVEAELIALTLPSLCELVWVLSRGYQLETQAIAHAVRVLLAAGNVAVNRPAAQAGLAMLEGGGDFADGVIAHEGAMLGAEEFVSFDRKAVALLEKSGRAARVPA